MLTGTPAAPRVYATRIFGNGVVGVGGSLIPPTAELDLTRIAPNPSAGEITIEFTLPDAGPARIEIVDVAGRLVESRDIASFGPGRHSLARFGERGLATGVYFARLRHGSSTRIRRFAIVR